MFSWTNLSAFSGRYVWTNEARLEVWIRKSKGDPVGMFYLRRGVPSRDNSSWMVL